MRTLTDFRCDCESEGHGHSSFDHSSCFHCIYCDACGWIIARLFAQHKEQCELWKDSLPKKRASEKKDPTLDSLELAITEISGDDILVVALMEEATRSEMRDIVGGLISLVETSEGLVIRPGNTNAWERITRILLSPEEDIGKLMSLLELFEESRRTDELKTQLTQVMLFSEKILLIESKP